MGDMKKLGRSNDIKEQLVNRFIKSREKKKMIPQIITMIFIMIIILIIFFYTYTAKNTKRA